MDRLEAEGDLFKRPHLPTIDPKKERSCWRDASEAGVNSFGTYVVDVNVEENLIKMYCVTVNPAGWRYQQK